jgi:hypothetical protein
MPENIDFSRQARKVRRQMLKETSLVLYLALKLGSSAVFLLSSALNPRSATEFKRTCNYLFRKCAGSWKLEELRCLVICPHSTPSSKHLNSNFARFGKSTKGSV